MVKPVGTKVRRSTVRGFSASGYSTAHLLTVLIRDLRWYTSRQHGTTVLPEWSHRGRALFRRHLCPKMGPQDEPIGQFNNSQCGAHDSARRAANGGAAMGGSHKFCGLCVKHPCKLRSRTATTLIFD